MPEVEPLEALYRFEEPPDFDRCGWIFSGDPTLQRKAQEFDLLAPAKQKLQFQRFDFEELCTKFALGSLAKNLLFHSSVNLQEYILALRYRFGVSDDTILKLVDFRGIFRSPLHFHMPDAPTVSGLNLNKRIDREWSFEDNPLQA